MKEFKYTIDGKEYKVQIEDVEGNIADVTVNGEAFKVEMEQEAEPEKKKVVLGQPAAEAEEGETASAANVNTANAQSKVLISRPIDFSIRSSLYTSVFLCT